MAENVNEDQQTPQANPSDISTLKTEVAVLAEQKEVAFAKKQAISTQIAQAITQIKDHKVKRDEMTKTVREKKVARDALNNQIKELIVKLKEITKDAPAPKIKPLKEGKDGDRRTMSPPLLKKEISSLNYKIETEGMSFENEQKTMKIIKEKQKLLDSLSSQFAHSAEARELSKQIDKLKDESDVVHEEIQKMAKASQTEHEAILSLSKQIDGMRVEEKQAQTESASLKATFREKAAQTNQLVEAANSDRVVKRDRKKADAVARAAEQQAQIKQLIDQQAVEVEKKIKGKKKLTTEDLLVFQAKNDSN